MLSLQTVECPALPFYNVSNNLLSILIVHCQFHKNTNRFLPFNFDISHLYVYSDTFILPFSPVVSVRLVRLTVFPNKQ